MEFKKVVEALVFASPKPISVKEIWAAIQRGREQGAEHTGDTPQSFAGFIEDDVRLALEGLREEYPRLERAYILVEQANGWTFVTSAETAMWVRQLFPEAKPTRLSGPALETLAIIAYRQPVTRADIEAVRGVAVDGMMQVLLDRGLIRICGRSDLPGRPLLYSTTEYFLQHFGIRATEELPNASELRRLDLPKAEVVEAAKGKKEKAVKAKAEEQMPLPMGGEEPLSGGGNGADGTNGADGADGAEGAEGAEGA